jgi:thioredoxin 1
MLELTNENEFNSLCQSNEYVLVDFYATWCGPCKTMSEYLNESVTLMSKVKCVKVNVEHLVDFCDKHDISSLPTLKLFKNGVDILRLEGSSKTHINTILNMCK